MIDKKLNSELARDVRNGKYEQTEGGLLFPSSGLRVGGVFTTSVNGEDEAVDHNLVVDEGLNHILSVVLGGGTQTPNWFIGLFEGTFTPAANTNAGNISASSTEFTGYAEGARVAYVPAAPATQSITNSASPASFTINVPSATVRGAFLASVSTHGATTGILLCASNFAAARAVINNDALSVSYSITAADA